MLQPGNHFRVTDDNINQIISPLVFAGSSMRLLLVTGMYFQSRSLVLFAFRSLRLLETLNSLTTAYSPVRLTAVVEPMEKKDPFPGFPHNQGEEAPTVPGPIHPGRQ